MRADLPAGTVTFLFTDVEGSTKLLHELGPEGYAAALSAHRRILRDSFAAHGGVEVDTQGDAFFVAFPTAPGALAAAATACEALSAGPIRVRMGIHTGTPHLAEEGYVGADVHRAARIAAAGHGGQVLVSAATVAVTGTDGLRELGEHRFKDFEQPVAIYQFGDERFPPLRTISNTNLPRPASSFVGREAEVAEVAALLRDGARLLTLTGPGGSGKTRLAIEAAATLVPEFKAGVFWVGLAPVRDPALVSETIGQTLGAKDGLAAHIGEREMLLLLDNLEQVVTAAPELASLVETCPHLRLMLTSRERLRVRGEVEYPVLPLADPEAVDLFCARAGTDPDDTIRRLCQALDNLPLAIELAAARASVLTPAQILERLSGRLDLLKGGRDADPRQQTLRATIEWSHELLTPDEQRLFARLSVFRGGCTLDAAEQVAEADLDTLGSLVDKSLLRRTGNRFWMLETIREFAGERLEASGEERMARDRHLERLLEAAERAHEALLIGAEGDWLPIIAAEDDNFRIALDWARQGSAEVEIQLAGAIAPYWSLHGYTREAEERLSGALSRYKTRDRIRARALTHRGEIEDDLAMLEGALELWRELGDARGEALALESIGWAQDNYGRYAEAQFAYEQSLAIREAVGVPEMEGAPARAGLCHALVATGEVERAQAMAEVLLAVTIESASSLMHQLALHFLADCPLVSGDYREAERRYLRALAFARSQGLVGRSTDEVLGVAMSLAGQGDSFRAVRLAAASYAKQGELGKAPDAWWRKMQERLLGGARADLTPEDLDTAERAGMAVSFDAVLDELLGTESEG